MTFNIEQHRATSTMLRIYEGILTLLPVHFDPAPADHPIFNGWRWKAPLSNAGSVVLTGLLVMEAGQRQQSKTHYLQLTDMRTEAVIGFI